MTDDEVLKFASSMDQRERHRIWRHRIWVEVCPAPRKLESLQITNSGTSPAIGAGCDVMLVQSSKGSVVLARDANGTITRKTDSVPETWEVVRDEETLRVCRKCFDDLDKSREEKVAAEDTATFD